jgi:hypothetical protein
MKILASFCNLPITKNTGILQIDFISNQFTPIKLWDYLKVSTCTGLTADEEHVYILCVSHGTHYLVGLRHADFAPVFCQVLPEIQDGHSILAKDGYLYVVSTGTDSVIRYTLSPLGVDAPQEVWRASESGVDTHHINSIIEWDGNLVISAFGPKDGTLWASASNGYIHDITRDIRVKSGIYHPHSLCTRGERLYYCESARGLFCSLEGPIFPLPGYARGVCWLADDLVCVGSSIGRRVSKSTGLIANPADPGDPTGTCSITIVRVGNGNYKVENRINLEWFGPEVYDLLTINDTL